MTYFDQWRAYLVLRENIAALRRDLGDDSAFKALESAVEYHVKSLNTVEEATTNESRTRRIKNHS
jgi:hypothetical protein